MAVCDADRIIGLH